MKNKRKSARLLVIKYYKLMSFPESIDANMLLGGLFLWKYQIANLVRYKRNNRLAINQVEI